MKIIISLFAMLFSLVSFADLQALDEEGLQNTTGQEGMKLSMKLDFAADGANKSRISTQNTQADNVNWQVIDNVTGYIEAKGMIIDMVDNFGPNGQSATRVTYPEEIAFGEFNSTGIYIGPGAEVGANHSFVLGVEIDGILEMPANTVLNTFVIKN